MTSRPIRAVVVAYHGADQLDRCLGALQRQIPVTVVDNSSSPDIRQVADRHGADYVDPGANLGFGPGVNVALRILADERPRDVLLLNPDAVLTLHALEALAQYLHSPANERVAAVSPRLLSPDGAEQRVAWPFPTPGRAWAEAVGLGRLPAHGGFVVGAVLLVRSEAIRDVGLFDERFFLYAEEADWQRRATERGWRTTICPGAVAEHRAAGASEDPLRREALFHAAQETYVRKWHGSLGWCLYRSAACLGAAVRAMVLSDQRRSEAARRARLYMRGPRRCAALVRE